MARLRKPFQGVWNIIQFNWPFYVGALIVFFMVTALASKLTVSYQIYSYLFSGAAAAAFFISLLVSWYVYDLSNLYDLDWTDELRIHPEDRLVNIHAGFDELSVLLKAKYSDVELYLFDFYNPLKHTEASIKRARKTYPLFAGTQSISTTQIPLDDHGTDHIFVVLSAHEIRDQEERICFFKELGRILKTEGKIVVIEHLRDTANFLAYTIGFLHFHSKATWYETFQKAGLNIIQEKKITPFISLFILQQNGAPL